MADDTKDTEGTFLTPLQLEVMKMRAGGKTQSEVARVLKTSRANICIAEKRARENIEKAKRTLVLSEKVSAPVRVLIEPGTDLFEVPKMVFTEATRKTIKVKENSISLVDLIRDNAPEKLAGRRVREPITVIVLSGGGVLVD
jgi:Tfx family DNA-binding protein